MRRRRPARREACASPLSLAGAKTCSKNLPRKPRRSFGTKAPPWDTWSPRLEALMTSTARKTRKEDHVRLRALNGLLHKAVAELLSTPEVSQEICDLCVEVSKVSVSPDFSACRVYWKTTLSAVQNQRTEAALQRSAAHMRHLLMAQQTLRNVPPIVFVQDKESAAMAQIDQLLAAADFGPPAGRDDSGQDPLRNPDSPPLCDTPAPAVHPSLCGIDHEALNKQITEYKRRKEKGRGSSQ
ncbi:putative ribosome-binding factor A, mitochondrial isoform X2 [Lepus europaeus]|uniref:putative ribosome-binding factor A, mitochondrial isoform X2 n=1 Tax=Lepus europaeus TaxID=9983 RepID=UPI002B467EF4|nr:putative ribosome-binding factor A, mitochondrial isoform X2 [Lepus europaeus]